MSEGFVGWLSFGVQVALAPGEDPEDFAEELAELMQFNLAAGIGSGERCLTGEVHNTDIAEAAWYPPLAPLLRRVHAPEV